MSDTAISVEHLGKSYLVGHNARQVGNYRYTALRDVLARNARELARKTADMLRGRVVVQGDEVEEFWALDDVSFEVKRGDRVGIIGRNGAGKSTLLKVLSRITEPTKGRVRIAGRVASLLEVGTGFHPELSGRENIYLNGAVLGMTRAEIRRKFDEIVDFAGVEKFLDTPVKRYSSGMYVRLAFAVAAHLEPEILAVDEVLAVGDAEFQRKCLGKMSEVAREGRTILFVSHNMNAVERLCQRVIWLDRGRIVRNDTDVRASIMAYLKGGEVEASRLQWTAAAEANAARFRNPYFTPTRFQVASAGGETGAGALSNAYPIEVLIEGEVEATDPALNIGIVIYDEEDNLLFNSWSADRPEADWPKISRGPISLKAVIPARLLNEGVYRVELVAQLYHRAWILEPRNAVPVVSFSIQGGLSDSPYWVAKRPGPIAPVLVWEATR